MDAAAPGMMFRVYELDVVTPESLGRFVHRWYGLPDRPPVDLPLPGVPEPLAGWYRVAARYSLPLSRDHVMRPWTDLRPENGMVRFWEGADDWYSIPQWKVPERRNLERKVPEQSPDAGVPGDPEVYENDEFPTGLSLSRFLVYAAVYEATYAPLHGLVYMEPDPDELRAVKVRLRELDDALWRWPDPRTRYYGDDDLLGHLGPDRVVLAARHRDALGRFDGLGLPWDWDTRQA
ncbi:hypothetical protein [Dactylosporangium fulvum]|uniref:Uncharacterized protein n=1 Tax=Dactylosporangium fulvum TaxID=53359 RepID=A0ABY5VUN9_9ACTN|nr:hypothetical protein [Dactylosporangium fulvum]UWP81310.1 hypothetical protein Dfulv_40335 [Dactylosporangium fulvum]